MAEGGDGSLVDLPKLDKLLSEQDKKLETTEAEIERWRGFSSDYEALKARLSTLPDKLSHPVTVPLGPLAFVPGRLVNTNEILVLLGDNWFCKTSAKNACAIIDRRLKHCNETLDQLQREQQLFAGWRQQTAAVQAEHQQQDDVRVIVEPLDEEKERHWREEHRRRMAAERRKQLEELKKETQQERDLMARLDALEKMEELRDELDRLSEDEADVDDVAAAGAEDDTAGADSDNSVIIHSSAESASDSEPEEARRTPLDSDDSADPPGTAPAKPKVKLRKRVSFSRSPHGDSVAAVHCYDSEVPPTEGVAEPPPPPPSGSPKAPRSILRKSSVEERGTGNWRDGGEGESLLIRTEEQVEPLPPSPPQQAPPAQLQRQLERPDLSEVFSYRIEERDPRGAAADPTAPPASPKRPLSRFRAARGQV